MCDKTWKASSYCQTLSEQQKIPYAIFFDRKGFMLQFPISIKNSVTEKMIKYKILHKLKQQYKKQTSTNHKTGINGLLLLHGNAPAHKSILVTDVPSKERVM